jgi:hypothetical protein
MIAATINAKLLVVEGAVEGVMLGKVNVTI